MLVIIATTKTQRLKTTESLTGNYHITLIGGPIIDGSRIRFGVTFERHILALVRTFQLIGNGQHWRNYATMEIPFSRIFVCVGVLLLTLYSQMDTFADGRRNAVRCDTQIGGHMQSTNFGDLQQFTIHNINCSQTHWTGNIRSKKDRYIYLITCHVLLYMSFLGNFLHHH